jgi:glycine cleavage system H protein
MAKEIPADRLFSEEHEWVKVDGNEAIVGITEHAQCSLGDVVYIELPEIGMELRKGMPVGVVESVKAVSDIYAPLSGIVKAVNTQLLEHPERINQDPYGEGWLILIEVNDPSECRALLAQDGYRELLLADAK